MEPKTSGRTPIDHAMNDGEDYELLSDGEQVVRGQIEPNGNINSIPLTCIGKVVERSEKDEPILLTNASSRIDLTGYAHFGNP